MIDKAVILVVETSGLMIRIISNQLHLMGVDSILTTGNGVDALNILKEQRVDMVFSEWDIPVITGLELLKAIRADERLSRLPFMMITSQTDLHLIKEAIACGVSDLLVKPYTADSLKMRVDKLLNLPLRSSPPVSVAQASKREVPSAPVTASSDELRPSILVVDDSPDMLLLLSNLFKDEYRVRIANSGEKALTICQSKNLPDLVLLDIMMPGIDGFEVARRLREHPASETIPVIFVTSMTGEDACRKGLDIGAVDFVTKPFNPDVLKPRVRNFMRYVELNKQLQTKYDGMLELARLSEKGAVKISA